MNKTLITLRYGISLRDFVNTGVVQGAQKKTASNSTIVVGVTDAKLIDNLNNIEMLTLPAIRLTTLTAFLLEFDKYVNFETMQTSTQQTIRLRDQLFGCRAPKIKHLFFAGLHFLIRRPDLIYRWLIRRIEVRAYAAWLTKHTITQVVSTIPFHTQEKLLLLAAASLGLPQKIYIQSWDNLTSKGSLLPFHERVVVWNRLIKEEVEQYYPGYRNKVVITGLPQFDQYFRKTTSLTRTLPDQYILYSTGHTGTIPSEPGIVQWFVRLVTKHFPGYQVLVRLHPRQKSEDYAWRHASDLKNFVTLQEPSRRRSVALEDGWLPDPADDQLLRDTIKGASLAVNIASTMTLDALASGVSVVNIAFDPTGSLGALIKGYYTNDHYARLMSYQVVPQATNGYELIEFIKVGLASGDDITKKTAYRRLIRDYCYLTDGQSAKRVAEALT